MQGHCELGNVNFICTKNKKFLFILYN